MSGNNTLFHATTPYKYGVLIPSLNYVTATVSIVSSLNICLHSTALYFNSNAFAYKVKGVIYDVDNVVITKSY